MLNPSRKKFTEITGIDSTMRPGDNFYRYVNGKWYDSISIPSTQTELALTCLWIIPNAYAYNEY
jgi:predicted metalloendopeptidase